MNGQKRIESTDPDGYPLIKYSSTLSIVYANSPSLFYPTAIKMSCQWHLIGPKMVYLSIEWKPHYIIVYTLEDKNFQH